MVVYREYTQGVLAIDFTNMTNDEITAEIFERFYKTLRKSFWWSQKKFIKKAAKLFKDGKTPVIYKNNLI